MRITRQIIPLVLGFLLARESLANPGGNPILIEAESLTVTSPGWAICPWGSNYFAAVYSNTFLSRQSALSLPAQSPESRASREFRIDQPGRYALLVRYEAPFRCETQFEVILEQAGIEIFRHSYGIRNNPRIWAFGKGITEEVAWPWGANENMVWEGQDTAIDLSNGVVRLTLIAGLQPTPAAQRNIDTFLLTTNLQDIAYRIRNESALPLDGWLTQAGDLYLRIKRAKPGPSLTLTVPPGLERSPGPIHLRTWEPLFLNCDQTDFGPWIEVGHLLDTLSSGPWIWSLQAASHDSNPRVIVECGQPDSNQQIQPFAEFIVDPPGLSLAYDGNLAQTHRLVSLSDCLRSFQQQAAQPDNDLRPVRFPFHPPLSIDVPASARLSTNVPVEYLAADDGRPAYPDLATVFRARSKGQAIRVGPLANLTPIGSPQMLSAAFDLAALGKNDQAGVSMIADIPAFSPGTTPGLWRRLVFAALARGARALDFGDAVPAPLTDSVYPLNDPNFLPVIHQTLRDIAASEDILLDGQPDPAWAAFWVSETGRARNDGRPPFGAHRRALYLALCHAQMPLVYLDEAAAPARLNACRVLVVTDGHVSTNATRLIADWVKNGGALLTTAGAGWGDESDRPNLPFRQLIGLNPRRLDTPLPDRIDLEKQDLPWAKPVGRVTWLNDGGKSPVFAALASTTLLDGDLLAKFSDGSPAVVFRTQGRGTVLTCNFLPGFTYLKPALSALPPDRNSDPNSSLNKLTSGFDQRILNLLGMPAAGIERSVLSHNPAVEVRRIRAPQGWVIPVINWSAEPTVEAQISVPHYTNDFARIFRASGEPLSLQTNAGGLTLSLTVSDADLIIFR
jgi:hypothetical protein